MFSEKSYFKNVWPTIAIFTDPKTHFLIFPQATIFAQLLKLQNQIIVFYISCYFQQNKEIKLFYFSSKVTTKLGL